MEELYIFPTSQENLNANENFYIVNCSKCDIAQQDSAVSRVRSDWSIVLMVAGSLSLHNENKNLSKGEFFIFPPEAKQEFSYSKNASFYWLYLSGKEVDFIIENFQIPTQKPCAIKQETLVALLDNIISEYLTKNLAYEELALLSAKSFLYNLKRELNPHEKKGKDLLKNIVFAMYSNPHISNTECAQICFMSRENFIRAFKAQYGMTPHKFKQNIIITRAKELLIKSNLTVTAISETLGFSDNPLYFNNYFKNIVGMYPLKFRTQNQTSNTKSDTPPPKKKCKKTKK